DDRRHRAELARVVGLARLQEGQGLLGSPVATPDKGDRNRLADAELLAERPRLRVGIGVGAVRLDAFGHSLRLPAAPDVKRARAARNLRRFPRPAVAAPPSGPVDSRRCAGDNRPSQPPRKETGVSWSLKGSYFETCSCELMCPCNMSFDHGATYDYCRVTLVFSIEQGEIEGTDV